MDVVGSSTEDSKRQKMFEGGSEDQHEDRISHLPESVLHYILSFLPTKYAVGTSVLSTRWKYLWTGIHNLDFFDSLFCSYQCRPKNKLRRKKAFFSFVDRVLLSEDVSHIHKFRLLCEECDASHFQRWTCILIRRKVEELNISIRKKPSYTFPSCLFASQYLRSLKIDIAVSLYIPGSICLSRLKHLDLTSITFFTGQSIREVSLSFPILEEFKIKSCSWLEIKTVNIFVPTLRMLTIEERYHDGLLDCELKINAESLISLKFRSSLRYEYSLCNLSSLVHAFMDISCLSETVRVCSVLRGIYNVRDLELPADSIDVLSQKDLSSHIQSLSRLIRLRVERGRCFNGKALLELLGNMPNLESIFFTFGLGAFSFSGHGRILGTTSPSYLSHLKLVDINHFRGINNEIWFVKFLIKSVRVMDELMIRLRLSSDSPERKQSVTAQLEVLTDYPKCVLDFGSDYHFSSPPLPAIL